MAPVDANLTAWLMGIGSSVVGTLLGVLAHRLKQEKKSEAERMQELLLVMKTFQELQNLKDDEKTVLEPDGH